MSKCSDNKLQTALRNYLIGSALTLTALGSSALGLGRVQGAAWIGKPLSVTVPVRLEIPEEPSALCPEVEVFQGDTRVNPDRVTVVVGGRNPREPVLQVRAAVLVEEPVVTLYVRVGCANRTSRRYVLLAEPEPEQDSAVPVPPAAASPPLVRPVAPVPANASGSGASAGAGVASGAPGSNRRDASSGADPRSQGRQTATVARPVDVLDSTGSTPKPRAVVRVPDATPPKMLLGRSRLKLDPVELLVERDPVLRSTRELGQVPGEADPRRSEMAALWKALNASPEDILKAEQRLVSMQTTLSAIETQHRQQSRLVGELRAELEKAKETNSRSQIILAVMGFLTALAALLAGFVWYRARKRSESAWWNVEDDSASKEESDPVPAPVFPRPEANLGSRKSEIRTQEPIGASGTGTTPLVVPISPATPAPTTETLRVLGARNEAPSVEVPEFVPSEGGASRAVNVDELVDVQQEADFFVSLGDFDKAIEVLTNHIAENSQTSALAYLDLLKIYHLQGRREDYEAVRMDFNRVFNAEAPAFDAYDQVGRGLEAYGSAISRIVTLWPSPKVLAVIEESIFRKPGRGAQAFDLEAYRELMLLHAIAKEIAGEVESNTSPTPLLADEPIRLEPLPYRPKFENTNIHPLSATSEDSQSVSPVLVEPATPAPTPTPTPKPMAPMQPGVVAAPVEVAMPRVPKSSKIGLDIDLSAFSGPEEAPSNARVSLPDLPPIPPRDATVASSAGSATPSIGNLIDFDLLDESLPKGQRK